MDYVELGFWLLAALAMILFFQTVLTWRKYRLLKAQYEQMQMEYEGERKALESLAGEVHSVMSAKSEVKASDNSAKFSEMQNRLENLETAVSIEHNKLEQAMTDLSKAKSMPAGSEEITKVKKSVAKSSRKVAALDKKLKKSSAKQIELSKKVTLLRGVKLQIQTSKRKLAELSQQHNQLKIEFQEHELVPIHENSVQQIEHLEQFLKATEEKIRQLEKKLEQA